MHSKQANFRSSPKHWLLLSPTSINIDSLGCLAIMDKVVDKMSIHVAYILIGEEEKEKISRNTPQGVVSGTERGERERRQDSLSYSDRTIGEDKENPE